ncbi:putative reverse transcriptase domain-containing protein [Tanacetum coccineum]
MAPKRTTRSTPATETTKTTSVTNAQLKELINQGFAAALAARNADRSMNGDDSHNLGRFERMETVFRISNCTVENQIKFAICNLLRITLMWWNSHVRTVGYDVAYAMTWTSLKKKMTDKDCPRGEIMKLEVEMFPEESDKIERYVGGLPNMIYGSVMTSKPKTMQDAIEMKTKLMDKKVSTMAKRQAKNKSKFDDTSRNNQNQQQLPKRQNVARAYTTGSRHYKRECPKLKNNNRGNPVGSGNAPAEVYTVGNVGTTPDSNVVTDLMPVELGSFDVIIGMDWLDKYHVVIVCDEKIVRVPFRNETLIIHGDRSNRGNRTRLNIISCTKTQKYLLKGYPIFLAHVTTKETKDKSKEKRHEDVPIVRDFSEVFPEDLVGIPPP